MTIEELNHINKVEAYNALLKCCGSSKWVNKMLDERPFNSKSEILKKAGLIWSSSNEIDGLEAFNYHPKIGSKEKLLEKFSETKEWSRREQSGIKKASDLLVNKLAIKNREYEYKFGFIFIVCATGKTAKEMLNILESRLLNERTIEIKIAMEEQGKIAQIRLDKLLV